MSLLGQLVADLASHVSAPAETYTPLQGRCTGNAIDAQVLAVIQAKVGCNISEITAHKGARGLTENAVEESVRRLKKAERVIEVRPTYHTPARYWPPEQRAAAAAFEKKAAAETKDGKILKLLRERQTALSAASIASELGLPSRTVLNVLHRMEEKKLVKAGAKVGHVIPWMALAE